MMRLAHATTSYIVVTLSFALTCGRLLALEGGDDNKLQELESGLSSLAKADDSSDRKAFLKAWSKVETWFDRNPESGSDALKLLQSKGKSMPEAARFCIMANLAGFGRITGLGPNYLDQANLGLYITIQNGLRAPADRERRIALDERLKDLKVTIESNANDDLKFQEILLKIIRKYDLRFDVRDDKTFFLTPGSK